MNIYYIITRTGQIGSASKEKIEKMYRGYMIFICDISDFKGQLLSSEYVD